MDVYRNHTIGVVVPSYNEEGFVGDVIDTIPSYVDRVYAVDDCSTDETWAEIQRHAAKVNDRMTFPDGKRRTLAANGGMNAVSDSRVVPIRHQENRGVGGAIKTGYLHARKDRIDVTAVLAGDGQMDPDILPRFIDPIVDGEADYAKGNRLVSQEYRSDMPRFRLFGNTILTYLTKISSGYWKIMDPQNGYTVISLEALERIQIEELYEYYGYPNDLLVKLNANKMRIADVPMPAVYGDEESSIRYPTYIQKVSVMLLRNFFWRLKVRYVGRNFHPLVLFYSAGIISTAFGMLGGLKAGASQNSPDKSLFVWAVSSCFLFVIGSLLVLIGALMSIKENRDSVVQIYD